VQPGRKTTILSGVCRDDVVERGEPGRGDHHQLLLQQRQCRELGVVDRSRHESGLDLPFAHGLEEGRRGARDDLDIDLRASRGIGREDRRQAHRRGRLERTDDDLSARHRAVRGRLLSFRHEPADNASA